MFKPEVFDFSGKSVIVTGAGRGIGRGIATALHKAGATVYAISKTEEKLLSLQQECPGMKIFTCDLSDWDASRKVVESFPLIDFLVNNAAYIGFNVPTQQTFASLDAMFKTNLAAIVNLSQVLVQKLVEAKKPGCIVNISSTAGLRPIIMASGYSALKAALDHWSRNLAQEVGKHNIRVNTINPGGVNTEMDFEAFKNLPTEVIEKAREWESTVLLPRKLIEVSEISNLVMFLLSDAAPMIHGSSIVIDGGYCIHS